MGYPRHCHHGHGHPDEDKDHEVEHHLPPAKLRKVQSGRSITNKARCKCSDPFNRGCQNTDFSHKRNPCPVCAVMMKLIKNVEKAARPS